MAQTQRQHPRPWRILAPLLVLLVVGACTKEPVTAPPPAQNHNPLILSLWAFPNDLGPADSMIVVCEATDQDGDTLVYDWFTDSRFIIAGNAADDHDLYNTFSKAHVFYRNYIFPGDTTGWVQCIVRDRKGGAAGRVLTVRVHL
jgi:hypothetical protein